MSRPNISQLRAESWERRCDPHWSREQTEIVEEMQCRRTPELFEMHQPQPKPVAPRVTVSMPCMVCLTVCDEHESRMCYACRCDDRRDRGS